MPQPTTSKQLLVLELNEVNFEFVESYARSGRLPNLARLIDRHGVLETTSESSYEQLEPWIQWVTAHTGLSYAEHGVFRLGDIVDRDIPQIWELLEGRGVRVGAICPMNAKFRLQSPAFFIPDPWTQTQSHARPVLRRLYRALSQAVNDNAARGMALSSLGALAAGFACYAKPRHLSSYIRLALTSIRRPWRRAIFLDNLLADVFVREVSRTGAQFATLFLNAAAHIQHHYMFSAAPYEGPHRNPTWYAPEDADPVYEVYRSYDHIIGYVQRTFPKARLMLATGLHQVPHEELTFYWRPRDHAALLERIGVRFQRVEPRMSRDFVVICSDEHAAQEAAETLRTAVADDGIPLFDVDNRGADLFVMLTYPKEIHSGLKFKVNGHEFGDLHRDVVFVALKNGEHHGTGYFLDTGETRGPFQQFPLTEMPRRILQAFNEAY